MAMDIEKLLDAAVKYGGSDLHIRVGAPPKLRIRGVMKTMGSEILTPETTEALMKAITTPQYQEELARLGSADFAITFRDLARFRVSVFRHQGFIGIVLRQIPNKLFTFEELGLPDVVRELCDRPRGLILVTGPTGSGKTTTLATMVDYINATHTDHIITIEDPIEFVHPHKKCVVTQREIGPDCPSFSEALRRALRQDPDVILVGEMRDLETISAALTAAETGHLVLGTLHTTSAAKTINRLIDAFPTNQQEQVRAQLSTGLIAVLSQQLLPTADGKGRVAAYELMIVTTPIQNMIRENQTFKIDSVIQTSGKLGMKLLDDHLFELYTSGRIKREDMFGHCNYEDQLMQRVRLWESEQGQGGRRR